jgi:hypothetical protein
MILKKSWKSKIAQATNGNQELNKKALQMKKSWDEVEKLLQSNGKTNKKSK